MIITLIIVLCTTISGFAQNKTFCGEVYYDQIVNFDFVYAENYKMVFTKKESLYKEINIESSNDIKKTLTSNQGTTNAIIGGRKNTTSKYYYNNKNNFYFKDNFSDVILVVKEDDYFWNWELHQEKKQIGNFSCQKATINFRGRNYVAWFTNEIPVPFGPWKFQGLPGLILEVYDDDNIFHIATKKVMIENKGDCEIAINKEEQKEALSIEGYLKRKEKIVEEIFAQMSSKLPKGSKPLRIDKNCEDCKQEIEKFNE